jgi:hypothetical protein
MSSLPWDPAPPPGFCLQLSEAAQFPCLDPPPIPVSEVAVSGEMPLYGLLSAFYTPFSAGYDP